ncbi:MAG: site-2 protease family protein [Hyphomonadaceae bacterium]
MILHELGHTLVGRSFGVPVRSITLFIFGGVAETESEPRAPLAELLMAVAGPIVSVLLGAACLLLAGFVPADAPPEYAGVLHYLGVLNMTLAAFNMAPAFPLDGGRVLRALIWMSTGDASKATRIAAGAGEVIGIAMMTLGALSALFAELPGGLWWIVLGWFISGMARGYRRDAEARKLLSGTRVSDLMTRDPVTAPADMSVEDFVETVLARHPHDVIPVTSDGEIVGAAGFKQAREIVRSQWRTTSLTAIAVPLSDLVVAEAGEPIEIALERLQRARMSRALVLNGGRLAGMLTLSDLAAICAFGLT